MFKYKNTTRFKMVVVIDSELVIIKSGDTYSSKNIVEDLGDFLILDDISPKRKDKK